MLRKFTFKNPKAPLPFKGERYTSGASGEIKHEHFHRYLFALQFCRQRDVLDIACGEGYGSALLGQVARQVTGVDLDPDAIRHANTSYRDDVVSFVIGDCGSIPLADASVDVVISFETLEHIAAQGDFFAQIKRVLRPNGVLVLSTPDKVAYADVATTPNPFHVRELSEAELRALVSGHFRNFRMFGQRSVVGSAITPESLSLPGADAQQFFKLENDGEVSASSGMGAPVYFVAVASDGGLPVIEHGLLDDRPFLLHLYALLQERAIANLESRHELGIADALRRNNQLEAERLQGENVLLAASEKTARIQLEGARAHVGKLEGELERIRRMLQASQDRQLATGDPRIDEMAQPHPKLAKIHRSVSGRPTPPLSAVEKTVKFLKRKSVQLLKQRRAEERREGRDLPPEALQNDLTTLQDSGLFDTSYYLSQNPDVAAAGVLAIQHFLNHGALEGRFPNRLFDPLFYLSTYPEIAAAGVNPLIDYITHGAAEGRNPSAQFSTEFYLANNPDVATSGANPLAHYLQFGDQEGRAVLPPHRHYVDALDPTNRVELPKAKLKRRMGALRKTSFAYEPLISVLVPTYNVEPVHLEFTVQSVLALAYPNWELHLVDDGSTNEATHAALSAIETMDKRIFVRRLAKNVGISEATNTALRDARGEFVTMLDHDDELTIDALHEVVRSLNADPSLDVIYSDQDYVSPEGVPVRQQLKPDWSPELFRGVMFVGHLLVARRQLALDVGGFDSNFDFVQDFEFVLRLSEHTKKIRHIAKILYHWRCLPTSVAGGGKTERGIEQLQARAVQAHLERSHLSGRVKPSPLHPHRTIIEWDSKALDPSIDLFVHDEACPVESAAMVGAPLPIPRQPITRCIAPPGWQSERMANIRLTTAPDLQDTPDKSSAAHRLYRLLSESEATFIIVMSADLSIPEPHWLSYLLLSAQEPDVAVVSATLLANDGSVEHAGSVIGSDGRVRSSMRGFNAESDGYAGSLSCPREISTCWGDLVVLRRSAIVPLLPVVPIFSTVDFFVADLALRATRGGSRAICTPRVKASLLGVRKRDGIRDLDAMIFSDIWSGETKRDPFYNPQFQNERTDYT